MSDSEVVGPRLTRTAPRASDAETPIAASTWEGVTLPEEQAAPEETAIPSRSKAMTAVSAFMPGTANSVVLGSRSAPDPKMITSGEIAFSPASSLSRSAPMWARSCSKPARAAAAARAEAGDRRHVLGAGAGAALLPAALDQRLEVERLAALDERADALGGADLVPRQRQKIGAESADITRDSPAGLDRVDVQQAAQLMN